MLAANTPNLSLFLLFFPGKENELAQILPSLSNSNMVIKIRHSATQLEVILRSLDRTRCSLGSPEALLQVYHTSTSSSVALGFLQVPQVLIMIASQSIPENKSCPLRSCNTESDSWLINHVISANITAYVLLVCLGLKISMSLQGGYH